MKWSEEKSKAIKRQLRALYLAWQSPKTPLLAKLVLVVVVAYAFSPIDLIPDFIPVLGYLDDLIILPVGIWIAVKLMPAELWIECQAKAEEDISESKFLAILAASMILIIWLFFIFLAIKSLLAADNN